MESTTIDSRFEIRDCGPDVGEGLFVRTPLKKGAFVIEYTGEKIPTKIADNSPSRYLFEIDKDWTLDGPVPGNLAGYINHSCEPNVEAEIEDGRVMIYATRDIAPGEELGIDYGDEYYDEFIKSIGCRCGAQKHH